MKFFATGPARFLLGLTAGAVIVYVDNVAFGGEVSPSVVVALLLAAAGAAGALGGRRGWLSAAAAWVGVPGAHLVKLLLGWPDTLHPNTYLSLTYLAAFTFCVTAAGFGGGVLLRRLSGRAE